MKCTQMELRLVLRTPAICQMSKKKYKLFSGSRGSCGDIVGNVGTKFWKRKKNEQIKKVIRLFCCLDFHHVF